MKKKTHCLLALLLIPFMGQVAFAGFFGPNNFWECVLDEMPGIANQAAYVAANQTCSERFPARDEPSSKRIGWIGPNNAKECILKYAKETFHERAAISIRIACFKLYKND